MSAGYIVARGWGAGTDRADGRPSRFPQFGAGRAVLAEGLRRLYEQGAQEVFVETDNYRDAAFALYESVGFRVARHVLVFRKDYE